MDDIDKLVLKSFPSLISQRYKDMLTCKSYIEKTGECLRVFELLIKTLSFILLNQYLQRDKTLIYDAEVNKVILENFAEASIGCWYEILKTILRTYNNGNYPLFISELSDSEWIFTASSNKESDIDASVVKLMDIHAQYFNKEFNQMPENEWVNLFDSVLERLRFLIGEVSFLSEYKLILIGEELEDGYCYWEQNGANPNGNSKVLNTHLHPQAGRYYLLKYGKDSGDIHLLELYPLIIDYKKYKSLAADRFCDSPFLYYDFRQPQDKKAIYLAASLWEKIEHSGIVGDIVRNIYDIAERIKFEKQFKLTWAKLKEISSKITERRLSAIKSKYDRTLYFQRAQALSSLKEFIESDQSCFVLIGNSGIGKSNFVMSLLSELADSNICILGYNGGTVDAKVKIDKILSSDFKNYIISGKRILPNDFSIIGEIVRSEEIENNTLLLVFDAINENPYSKLLLTNINQFIEASPWKWLKILITSRPEAWRTIKKGLELSKSFYYCRNSDDLVGYTMKAFSYSVELTPFHKKEELPVVYQHYANKYQINTTYDSLNPLLKEILCTPLMMQIVAETYRGEEIPHTLQKEDIFKNFFESLLNTERIFYEDIVFLHNEIVSRMINDNQISNSIKGNFHSNNPNTPKLTDLIQNTSFRNLCDAKILNLRIDGLACEIGFTYERFYDYFAGKQFFLLVKEQLPEKYFGRLSSLVDQKPFIWGAVVHALKLHIENNEATIINLALFNSENIRALLTYAIAEYGGANLNKAKQIILNLFDADVFYKQKPTSLYTKTSNTLSSKFEICKKIAIEAAYKLSDSKMEKQSAVASTIFERGLMDRNPNIRAISTKYVFYRSHEDIEFGLKLLERLKYKVGNFFIKSKTNLTLSFLGLSALLFFKFNDPEVWKRIQLALKSVIDNIIPFKNIAKRLLFLSFWTKLCRKIFLFVISKLFNILFRHLEDSNSMVFSVQDLKAFYKSPHDKAKFIELIPYIDSSYGSILSIRDTICEVTKHNDILPMYLVTLIFTSRLITERNNVLAVYEDVFEIGLRSVPANCYIPAITASLSVALTSSHFRNDRELWDIYKRYIRGFYSHSANICSTKKSLMVWSEHSRYCYLRLKEGTSELPELIREFIEDVKTNENWEVLSVYIKDLSESILLFGFERAVVEHILSFSICDNPLIKETIVEAVAKLYIYFRTAIEDILNDSEIPDHFKKLILSKENKENIGSLIVRSIYEFWSDNVVFNHNKYVINEIQKIAFCIANNRRIGKTLMSALEALIELVDNK